MNDENTILSEDYISGFIDGQIYLGDNVIYWIKTCTNLTDFQIECLDQNMSEWRKNAIGNIKSYKSKTGNSSSHVW